MTYKHTMKMNSALVFGFLGPLLALDPPIKLDLARE